MDRAGHSFSSDHGAVIPSTGKDLEVAVPLLRVLVARPPADASFAARGPGKPPAPPRTPALPKHKATASAGKETASAGKATGSARCKLDLHATQRDFHAIRLHPSARQHDPPAIQHASERTHRARRPAQQRLGHLEQHLPAIHPQEQRGRSLPPDDLTSIVLRWQSLASKANARLQDPALDTLRHLFGVHFPYARSRCCDARLPRMIFLRSSCS